MPFTVESQFQALERELEAEVAKRTRLEEALIAVSGYLYKRSKYGDEEADAILAEWYPEAAEHGE